MDFKHIGAGAHYVDCKGTVEEKFLLDIFSLSVDYCGSGALF